MSKGSMRKCFESCSVADWWAESSPTDVPDTFGTWLLELLWELDVGCWNLHNSNMVQQPRLMYLCAKDDSSSFLDYGPFEREVMFPIGRQ